jgi:putative addiction module killer protein
MILEIYQDENGKEPFNEWLYSIKDIKTQARIDNRLERLRVGNFGDCRTLSGGIFELRLHFGPGYRIYYGRLGNEIVVLLIGGDKSNQVRDIKKAQQYWEDYKRNK